MITKRTFLEALGCRTAGWYRHRDVAEAPGPGLEWQFHTGNEIGRLAQRQLGPGLLLPRAPLERAIASTAAAIADGSGTLLYEASFASAGCIARADALRRTDAGWEMIEVKSALVPEDGKLKSEYVDDIAYTAFVAADSGVSFSGYRLMFLDRTSRRDSVAFGEVDVTELVRQRIADFAASASEVVAACASESAPPAALQFICKNCEYFAARCVGKDVDDPLFLLPRISPKKFEELKPFARLSAVPTPVVLTDPQLRVFEAIRSGEPGVDRGVLEQLSKLVWPVYYLDFEAVAPALPWFDGCAPYEVLPFQYSIHVCDRPGHEIAHHEYLAPIGGDWREELAVSLIRDLGESGSIAMYTDYEQRRLAALAKTFPQHASALEAIIARLVDFEPIVRKGYCHPGFLGRTSIKNVLPVIAPELSYRAMAVGNGLDAEGLFALMTVARRDPEDHDGLRRQLLEYCKLDTRAMVRLHAALATL